MGIGDQQVLDKILILDGGGRTAAPAATLGLVVFQRLGLGITVMGNRHHPLFRGDQVFGGQVQLRRDNLGTARIIVFTVDRFQFVADNRHQAVGIGQDVQVLGDLFKLFLVLDQQLVILQAGQLLQAHVEDILRLHR